MTPVVIAVAITGSVPRKRDNPAVPITPAEQTGDPSMRRSKLAPRSIIFTFAIPMRARLRIRPFLPKCKTPSVNFVQASLSSSRPAGVAETPRREAARSSSSPIWPRSPPER